MAELKDGVISEYDVSPEDFGLHSQTLMGLEVDGPQASLELIRDALGRRKTEAGKKAGDLIVLNAGAALYAAGVLISEKAWAAESARHSIAWRSTTSSWPRTPSPSSKWTPAARSMS